MILQQVQVKQKSLKVKTNRKKNSRNQQSRRKSRKRRKIKSKSNMKKKSKKSKSRQNDGNPDLNIENYSTQLRKCLQNDLDCEDIYKILNDVCIYYKNILTTQDQRSFFFNTISWSIPTKQNINDIIKFIRSNECPYILEIGSGLGLWASILKNTTDIKVNATDDFSWYKDKEKMFCTEIENINYTDAIYKYNDENSCLFLCWPPPDNDLAAYCLKNFKGKYLIYIGQPRNGQTANSAFFDMLKICEQIKEVSVDNEDEDGKYTSITKFDDNNTGIAALDAIYFYKIKH